MKSANPPKDRILFASCSSQHYDQVLWPAVLKRNASAFVWSGDAVYSDTFEPRPSWALWKKRKPLPATPEVITSLYERQLEVEGYKELLTETNTVILGAQDDHDYGINNGDCTYEHKGYSATAFVKFLSAHRSSTNLTIMQQRASSGKGVYGVKVLDFSRPRWQQLLTDQEAGLEIPYSDDSSGPSLPLSNRSVAIFLLDVRSNKTPWNKHWKDKYKYDYSADFLGEEQWQWLEHGLHRSTATVNVIVSGLQVHADRYYNGNAVEDWSRFPMAQHRLYQAILGSPPVVATQDGSQTSHPSAKPTVIVSGDVHMAEFLRKDCHRIGEEGNKRMLLEVTSSGMTHSWGTNICARPQLSLICQTPYFAWCLKMGMHWAHKSGAWTDVVKTDQVEDNGRKGLQYALERNFGEFEFDWERRRVTIRVLGEDLDDQVILSTSWDFDTLAGTRALDEPPRNRADYAESYELLLQHGANEDDWICVSYGGQPSRLLKLYGAFSPIFLSGFLACVPLLIPLVVAYVLMRPHHKKAR